MKKSVVKQIALWSALGLLSAAVLPASAEPLFVRINNDGNKGSIDVDVHSAGGQSLKKMQLASGQSTGDLAFDVKPGNYAVSISWGNTEFHNISGGGGSTIACRNPPTGQCMAYAWQITGTGALGTIPIYVPAKK